MRRIFVRALQNWARSPWAAPAEAKGFVEEEAAKWQRVIAKTGVRVD